MRPVPQEVPGSALIPLEEELGVTESYVGCSVGSIRSGPFLAHTIASA